MPQPQIEDGVIDESLKLNYQNATFGIIDSINAEQGDDFVIPPPLFQEVDMDIPMTDINDNKIQSKKVKKSKKKSKSQSFS